ncbi:MAG: SDR family NAD(P)-dependent oxidoreductase [Pseudomonadota bacterium]
MSGGTRDDASPSANAPGAQASLARPGGLGLGFRALVCGASGAIGAAFVTHLEADEACAGVTGLSRSGTPPLDLTAQASIATCAQALADHAPFHLIIDATGMLHDGDVQPEKALRAIDPDHMARSFAVNATGPALLLKHFAALLPRDEPCVFAKLSARVGSIGDNRLGGWYAYRASKAALNMLLKAASIELARTHRQSTVLALHPGTVVSALSDPFAGTRERMTPHEAAGKMLRVIGSATPADTGSFRAYDGTTIPW